MSMEQLRPKTIAGIKNLAKAIRKRDGITHSEALDAASVQARFSNFKHAQRVLGSSTFIPISVPKFSVYLTVSWRDRKSGGAGSETIRVAVDRSLDDMIKPAQYKHTRGLGRFKRWASDHLVSEYVADSSDDALNKACAGGRTLQFICATQLRPSTASKSRPKGYGDTRIPGLDHASTWFDPATKRYIVVDEPYSAAIAHRGQEREAWSNNYGWDVIKAPWAGMYYPDGGSEMYLLSERAKGLPVKVVYDALAKIDAAIVTENCHRVDIPEGKHFQTPGELSDNASREARKLERKPRTMDSSVPYALYLSGKGRRPNDRMTIAKHAEVGKLLKAVLVGARERTGVEKRLDAIRSELDNWVQLEYDRNELSNDEFFDLYYHEHYDIPVAERGLLGKQSHIEGLSKVRSILTTEYPDCVPLRQLLGKIDMAMKSLKDWK